MRKSFIPLLIVTAALFAYAPVAIAQAPYESTMLLVQKIFYIHFASWMGMYVALYACGIASGIHVFTSNPRADRVAVAGAEIAALFGLMGLVTGPLWARKAWGVWWQWDARLTMTLLLELILVAYLLVRKYGGPGSEKLAAGLGRGRLTVRLQSRRLVAHGASADHGCADARAGHDVAALRQRHRVRAVVGVADVAPRRACAPAGRARPVVPGRRRLTCGVR
jgi:ABC-type transport system involved in cytochrome c biogenesis permease subunit